MQSFSHVSVLQGSLMLFAHHETGGEMWNGQGLREILRPVTFETPFQGMPVVHTGLGLIDAEWSTNMRTDLSAVDMGPRGFVIRFVTWGDTRIARIRADWIAIGPGQDPSLWEVD